MQQKIRVLVVGSKYLPEYAGSGLRIHNTYKRLHEKYGIEWGVLAGSTAHFGTHHYAHEGINVTRISSKLKNKAFQLRTSGPKWQARIWNWLFAADEIWKSWRWLRSNGSQFDLVHAYGHSWCVGTAVIWAKMSGKAIIRELVTAQASPHHPERMKPLLDWALKSQNARIVAISKQLEARCRQLGFTNVWHRPNPVDEQRFFVDRAKKNAYRTKHSRFSPSDVLIVEISNYRPGKNKAFLLEVMAQLPQEFKLLIAGPLVKGNEAIYDDICQKIKSLGLEDRVQVKTGFVNEVHEYMKMGDLFAFPSLHEGLGTPVLEAIACGVPVVANKIEQVTDIWIINGVNGFTSGLNPVEFADKIQKAVEIDERTLDETSKQILAQASSEVIDQAYYEMITSLRSH